MRVGIENIPKVGLETDFVVIWVPKIRIKCIQLNSTQLK